MRSKCRSGRTASWGWPRPITRRDFLDGVAIGTGALVLGSVLPGCDLGGGDDDEAPAGRIPTG